ncbi:MAG TPA: hypothetical protein VK085_10440 [Pseudogracilibacillus sp.]|nr:hypothetical protein [Pseudogracilibacillus sp.]
MWDANTALQQFENLYTTDKERPIPEYYNWLEEGEEADNIE